MAGNKRRKKSVWHEMKDELRKVKVSENPKTNFIVGLVWFLISVLFILYMFFKN